MTQRLMCDCCTRCSHPYLDCVGESVEAQFGPCSSCRKKIHLVTAPCALCGGPDDHGDDCRYDHHGAVRDLLGIP